MCHIFDQMSSPVFVQNLAYEKTPLRRDLNNSNNHIHFFFWEEKFVMAIFCCFVLLIYILCFLSPSDVLLDMKASGGDLGWLPSPSEEGVSVQGLGQNSRPRPIGFTIFHSGFQEVTALLISLYLHLTL